MLNIFQIFREEFSQVIHKIAQEKNIIITENDLTVCLSKAHGISIVALIE